MRITAVYIFVFFAASALAASSGKECPSHSCKEHSPHGHSVEISEEAARNAGIRTVHPRKIRDGGVFSFKGRFELVPEARETIGTPVPGKLTLRTASLKTVTEGETLFTVTSPEIVLLTEETGILEKRLAVYRETGTRNAELENSLSFKKARLSSLLMGYKAENGTVEIKAPKAGLVENVLELNGTWLESGESVLTLTDTSRLRFKGVVAATDAGRLENGMKAESGGAEGVIRMGVGEESGLVPVYIMFSVPPRTVAGARGTATVFTGGEGEMKIAVPDSAIVDNGIGKQVFIRDPREKNRFIAVNVSVLSKAGGWTAVKGLPAGHCDVVSKGAYELKLASSDEGGKAAGHFHADGTFHEGEH